MKIKTILRQIDYKLARNKIIQTQEAEKLLSFVLHRPVSWLIAHDDYDVSEITLSILNKYTGQLASGEPLEYIIGCVQFHDREFCIDKNVFIPRIETELLVDIAITEIVNNYSRYLCHREHQRSDLGCQTEIATPPASGRIARNDIIGRRFPRLNLTGQLRRAGYTRDGRYEILEIGTGSGIIAITLAIELKRAHIPYNITATDISLYALKVTRENAKRHDVKIKFVESNLAEHIGGQSNIIVANLPYVPTRDIKNLHDPQIALNGGLDGMKLIKKMLKQIHSRQLLKRDALILLEIGHDQGISLSRFIKELWPKAKIKISKDLAGYDRVLFIKPNLKI